MPITDILQLKPETKVQLNKDARDEVLPRNCIDLVQGNEGHPDYNLIRMTFPHGIPGAVIARFETYFQITRRKPTQFRLMDEALREIIHILEVDAAGKYTVTETGQLSPDKSTVMVVPDSPLFEGWIHPEEQ